MPDDSYEDYLRNSPRRRAARGELEQSPEAGDPQHDAPTSDSSVPPDEAVKPGAPRYDPASSTPVAPAGSGPVTTVDPSSAQTSAPASGQPTRQQPTGSGSWQVADTDGGGVPSAKGTPADTTDGGALATSGLYARATAATSPAGTSSADSGVHEVHEGADQGLPATGPHSEPDVTRLTVRPTSAQELEQTEEPKSRAGRNLPQAIAVGVILGALVAGALFFSSLAFLALATFASMWAAGELVTVCKNASLRAPVLPVMVGASALPAAAYVQGGSGVFAAYVIVNVVTIAWAVVEDNAIDGLRGAATGIFITTYIPMMVAFVIMMLQSDHGVLVIAAYISMTVASDIGGYAVGVLRGKHPMAPGISPGKTWEGFVGSLAAAALVGAGFSLFGFDAPLWVGLGAGIATAMAATLGDLAMSLLKRDIGIKDMGSALPGHGGLMDRMDSLIVAAPVAYACLVIALG